MKKLFNVGIAAALLAAALHNYPKTSTNWMETFREWTTKTSI